MGVKVVQALVANTQPTKAAGSVQPGRGRSHTGSTSASLGKPCVGPILLVTMTNHALDQFLENLLRAGIKNLIRVGGQSKSAVLEPLNLNELWRDARSKHERDKAKDARQCALLTAPDACTGRCSKIKHDG